MRKDECKIKRLLQLIIFLSMIVAITPACSHTPKIVDANGMVLEKSIAVIEVVNIGGVEQCIIMRGVDVENPVLLYIHGGPGIPDTPMVIKYNSDLESDFVVVNWDQRGTGKSYSKKIPTETINVEQFISDAHELVQYLKNKFDTDKIYIVGHSWGSVMGMYLIDRYPEDFYAYVGIGQVVNIDQNEIISYEFTLRVAEETQNKKALKELHKIGPPVKGLYKNFYDDLMIQRKWLLKFGGALHGQTSYLGFFKDYIFSKEYKISEALNVLKGSKHSVKIMWKNIAEIDFFTEIDTVDVPVYFFVGRHDWNTPFELAEKYYNILEAPQKELIWFESSAHSPCYEEPEKFNRLMVEKVKAETLK